MTATASRPRRALALLTLPAFVAAAATATPAQAADPFTLIVVPDTQNYTDFGDINTEYNVKQMQWIRDNRAGMNIKFVMHLGDFQNPGNPYRTRTDNIYEPDLSKPIGTPAEVQDKIDGWNRANAAINVLDNNDIPYSLVPGNHDYRDHNSKDEPYLYLKTFGPDRYVNNPKYDEKGQQTYGGASPASPTFAWAGMNTYHRFHAGGRRFLNIALQFDPDDNDLRWAQQIINENPGLPTIVTTHSYVNTKPANNDYQRPEIFDKLVKNNPQVVMTFNGHLTGAHYVEGTNIAGQSVHQMLVDFQASQLDAQLGANYYRGAGVLRQVEVNPDTGRVNVKDYSTVAKKFLPRTFTAPDNDKDIATYDTPAGFDIDFNGRFGLQDKAGIVKSTSFRQGTGGYTGTGDTYIDQNAGTTNFGEEDTIWVDGDRNGTGPNGEPNGSPDSQAMIRFNNLFGTGPGQIPAGAQIESAELVLHTSDRTDAQSPNTIALHRLLQNWNESAAVWNTFNGFANNGTEAILAANDTVVPNVRNGFVSFDVTESLYALSMGADNLGWVLRPGGSNGWQFDSSEHVNALYRPQLNVTYRVVPEPGAVSALFGGTLALLARRRRTPRVA